MQDKIHQKLLKLAGELGGDDFRVSAHDCSDSYHSKAEVIAAGDSLVELLDEESFVGYIMENPELMEAYIQGYASVVDFEDDLPEDINEGSVVSISVYLTDEQQSRVRELVKKNLQES